jgi:hypothetical protein
LVGAALPVLLLSLCSCKALVYAIAATAPEPTEKVKADYTGLEGRRVLILVWADQATLFEHPHIRFELAEYVAYQLKDRIDNIGMVSNRSVADYQQSNYDWASLRPQRVGEEFKADVVIHVELLEYTTRGSGTRHLLSGRGRAAVGVYEVADEVDEKRAYRTEVHAKFPEKGTLGVFESSREVVHAGTLDLLAKAIAQKFYDHEMPL